MSLIRELNRRNVTRVALLYMLAAWLLIQVAETVLPLFEVPDGVLRGVVLLLVLGFLPALAFAWVFELTEDGLKLERDVEVPPEVKRRTANRLDIATLTVAVLAIGLLIYDRSVPVEPASATRTDAPANAAPSAAPANDRPEWSETVTVAVLPFVNMSPDPSNAFFAEGVSEEILNLLSRVPRLRVVGRTSSFRFRGSDSGLRSIGEQLGATHLLEGSVRRSEDRVRVTAQLVHALDGVRLWNASWDRELDDIFAVQDEIGREVTAALREQLAAEVADPSPLPKTDPEGYTAFLRARALLANRGAENMHTAVGLLEESLRIDPNYAPAHAVLAQTLALLPLYDFADPSARPGWIARAEASARRALDLDPALAMAWSALGTAQAHHQWDWDNAQPSFDRAVELAPADAEILNLAGDFQRILGDIDAAIHMESEALRLDPLRAFNHSDLAHAYHLAGDCERALEFARSGIALDPAQPYGHLVRVLCNGELGRLATMRLAVDEARETVDADTFKFLMLEFWLALAEDDRRAAREILLDLAATPEGPGRSPARVAFGWLQLGESEQALQWLEKAYADRDWSLVISAPVNFRRIHEDPVTRRIFRHPELDRLYRIREQMPSLATEA